VWPARRMILLEMSEYKVTRGVANPKREEVQGDWGGGGKSQFKDL